MFALSSSASVTAGAAFLGGASTLRAKQTSARGNAGRAGPVKTQAFFGVFGGAPKQVRVLYK